MMSFWLSDALPRRRANVPTPAMCAKSATVWSPRTAAKKESSNFKAMAGLSGAGQR